MPWTAGRSNQSILKETSSGCSLEGLMLRLKLQYFGHLIRRVDPLEKPWCWEGLGAGGEGDDRGWDGWMASLTQWTWAWVDSGSWWWTGRPGMLQSMGLQRIGHDWVTKLKLISFSMDWLDIFAIQGTLESLLQHHSLKSSILRCSAFFIVQLSHPYMTTGKPIALTRQTFVGKVMSLLFNMLSS